MADDERIWPGLIGGNKARKLLGAALKNNRLFHNYLLEGPIGIGKFPFAIAFARSILCSSPVDGISCNECEDCCLFNLGHHPDALVMSRESELSVDEARQINNIIMLSPQRAEQKVVVLDGIDRVNPSAGNAMLKTLEESPGGTIFILTTHRPEKLLPTILSRSLRVPFYLMSAKELTTEFMRVLDIDENSAQQTADMSGGRPGWGIRFIIHPEFRNLYDYGHKIITESLMKEPLGRIFDKENLISEFLTECARIFTEQDNTSGMDGLMIAQILNGEEVKFKPVNIFLEDGKTVKRNLDSLGFVMLGGIFRGMLAKAELEGDPLRYVPLMKAFLEVPKNLERNFNKDLVIEKFILRAHRRYKE